MYFGFVVLEEKTIETDKKEKYVYNHRKYK
jgi:hypothetical protein